MSRVTLSPEAEAILATIRSGKLSLNDLHNIGLFAGRQIAADGRKAASAKGIGVGTKCQLNVGGKFVPVVVEKFTPKGLAVVVPQDPENYSSWRCHPSLLVAQ